VTEHLATIAEEAEAERVRRKFSPTGLSEKVWQSQVVAVAKLYGWRVFHPLRSKGSGWPDLALLRPPRLLLVELKTEQGRLRPAQREWLRESA
jgi:hypothetical protein